MENWFSRSGGFCYDLASNLTARMKNHAANSSKEQGGGGVVSRYGFVMGFGFVTRSRFIYRSGFVTGSGFVKGFGFITLWIRVCNFMTVTFRTAANRALYYYELP
jgi:hypothetical protein